MSLEHSPPDTGERSTKASNRKSGNRMPPAESSSACHPPLCICCSSRSNPCPLPTNPHYWNRSNNRCARPVVRVCCWNCSSNLSALGQHMSVLGSARAANGSWLLFAAVGPLLRAAPQPSRAFVVAGDVDLSNNVVW